MNVLEEKILTRTEQSIFDMIVKGGYRKYMVRFETDNLSRKLRRIVACKNFGSVRVGDVGGYVEFKDNLSHDGSCWIGDDAEVSGNAVVYEDAQVYEKARVWGAVHIYGQARVHGNCLVSGDSFLPKGAKHISVKVFENANIYEKACISGEGILVHGDANVHGYFRTLSRDIVCERDTPVMENGKVWVGDRWIDAW